MKYLAIVLVVCGACLSGCASAIPAGSKPKLAPPSKEKAIVYVIDDLGGISLGSGEIIVVNGATVGSLSRRQYTWFYMRAGQMAISMNDPAIKSRKLSARIFTVEAGKTYFVRYKILRPVSDGALLMEIASGVSKNRDIFKPEDLALVPESTALDIIKVHTLVGSNSP